MGHANVADERRDHEQETGRRPQLISLALAGLLLAFMLVPAARPAPASAESSPDISGDVYGLEWCHQALCGSANFSGVFVGKVGWWPAVGAWSISVTHDSLPRLAGESTRLTGGSWHLATWRGIASGSVSGTLTYNGDGTFSIDGMFTFENGGDGTLQVSAVLDHNHFPPRVSGDLSQ